MEIVEKKEGIEVRDLGVTEHPFQMDARALDRWFATQHALDFSYDAHNAPPLVPF
jgi:hypothetical protein